MRAGLFRLLPARTRIPRPLLRIHSLMRQPCDEVVIRSSKADSPCRRSAQPWILAATILGSSMAFIDGTVVNVALPALQSALHATLVDVQWVVESYGLFLSALILVGGALGDAVGRRKIFLLGVLIFAVASVFCGLSFTITELIIGRCFQGIGAALMVPSSLAIISASFDESSRGAAIGTWSGFTAITMAVGPVLGGWLIEHASWHWAFFINIPLAIAVIAISFRHVPESRSPDAGRIDWPGATAATIGLGALVYGFLEAEVQGWHSVRVFLSLFLSVSCLVTFIIIESRCKSPMVPLTLFRSSTFSGANLLTLFLYSGLGVFFFVFPLNLIQVQHYSPTAAGAASLPFILLMFFLSRWSGGLIKRYGAKLPLMIGPVIAAIGFAMFAIPSTGGSYWTSYFVPTVVLGFGMAVTVAPLTTVVMNSIPVDRVGTASGVNNAIARVAGVQAVAVLGVVIVTSFSRQLEGTLGTLNLPQNVAQTLQSETIKLAGMDIPPGIDTRLAQSIRALIDQSFISSFRLTMLICSVLAILSSTTAWLMIESSKAASSESLASQSSQQSSPAA